MQHRLSLLFALIFPLGMTSCFGPPLVEEVYPYGPPKYGQQGTPSPPPPQQQQQQQQQQPQGQQGEGYTWQSHPGSGTTTYGPNAAQGDAPNQPVDPINPAPGGIPQGTVPTPSNSEAASNSPGSNPGSNPGGGSAPAPKSPAVTSNAEIPYGIPVPGKDGMLFSPYSPDAGFIDITTPNADGSKSVLPPGTKIKDPFSNKPILVP